MPGLIPSVTHTASVPSYISPPTTKEPLEYAELAIIDLSKTHTQEGRLQLAAEVTQAIKTLGFFYAINHGYTPEQTNEIFAVAQFTFDGVTPDEKASHTSKSSLFYDGYKPQKTWLLNSQIEDQIEQFNMTCHLRQEALPQALQAYHSTMEAFAQHNQYNVVHPILRLLALGLELPEETLLKQHNYNSGHSSVRFMKYHPRSSDEELATKNVWLKGHTDYGTITTLWSQPVSGLQILLPDGKWRWVKHMDNALVVIAGDALEFLSGGFYPATRHRVVRPPADQLSLSRLGAFYFAMPDDEVKLVPYEDSPVSQRVGISRRCDPRDAPTMDAWRKGRMGSFVNQVALKPGTEEGVEVEVINGVLVKHYN